MEHDDWLHPQGQGHATLQHLHLRDRATLQHIDRGIEEWRAARLSYEDDKLLLNTVNFFQRMHAFFLSELAQRPDTATGMSWVEVLTCMLNSGRYMLSSRLLMNTFGQMHFEAAAAYWALIMGSTVTDAQVEAMVCVPSWKSWSNTRDSTSTRPHVNRPRDTRRRYFEHTPPSSPPRSPSRDQAADFTSDYMPLQTPTLRNLPDSSFARRHAARARPPSSRLTPRHIHLSSSSDSDQDASCNAPGSSAQHARMGHTRARDSNTPGSSEAHARMSGRSVRSRLVHDDVSVSGEGMEEEDEEGEDGEGSDDSFIDDRDDDELSEYSR